MRNVAMAEQQSASVTQTTDVVEKHKFDEAKLVEYMAAHVEGFAGPVTVSQFAGGQSNPTYKLETPTQNYVLRRKPPGKLLPSAHAVDREYRVISALNATDFPVPHAYCLCEDEDVIGTTFYIMECVEGRVFWDFRMLELSKEDRGKAMRSMCQNLALLHSFDYKALGLETFGRPGNYFARQIARWTKQYQASETVKVEAMDKLIEWLPTAIPEDDSISLVHGDYALHNLLFHPEQPRVVAALDWELSTIGHPLGDLFYNTMAWYTPDPEGTGQRSFINLDCTAHGIPTLEEYIDWYCQLAGRKPVENPSFYKAYNLFRIGGIVQGIVGRILDGTANDPTADAQGLQARVRATGEAAWAEAQKAGAI
jgi:aminoglycoside phosphotransferase (APT) family kinase protein